jgi:hypothetical protein
MARLKAYFFLFLGGDLLALDYLAAQTKFICK